MTQEKIYPKKLIEVALPLDDIDDAAELEKSPFTRKHPRSLHVWWARRPLAAARAVLFAQLVNDPGGKRGYQAYKGQTKEDAQRKRDELFDIIRDLVKWENTNNEEVLEKARAKIRESWEETCKQTGEDPAKMPPFLDPFAGGGAIPLEAQRLGLEAHASDLNPVAVMINKAMIEIPPKFAGQIPIGPVAEKFPQKNVLQDWSGANGLAEDVRRYGAWMREEAEKRIGHLYPKADLPKEYGGGKATVIAWLWARTVASPNPALNDIHVPLISSFFVSTKKGKEAYVEPVIEGENYRFTIKTGKPSNSDEVKTGTKLGRGANFRCLISGVPISPQYIKDEGKSGRMGARLMAIVAEGKRRRIYLEPTAEHEVIAQNTQPSWKPDQELNYDPRAIWTPPYGLTTYADLFTSRQLVALTTFSDLVLETREQVITDAKAAGMDDDNIGINDGGTGATAYGDAVVVYLSMATSRWADMSNTICGWNSANQNVRALFARQAIPMSWDYAELSPFSPIGSWYSVIKSIYKLFDNLKASPICYSSQKNATDNQQGNNYVISTDPPYYDNIGYADLSDFFYVWLRRSLKSIFPCIFSTLLVPKEPELVATPYRHAGKGNAEKFFLDGMTLAIHNMAVCCHSSFPVTIYYAFKQSETKDIGTISTGWVTFLEAVKKAGFSITGTWPIRTERKARSVALGTNALASSIVLVCRKRDKDAATISRKQFLRELEETLPDALEDMIGGKVGASPIAPVDLAQAAIGPGMGVYSQYTAVLEADGSPMTVHAALILINKAIDEYFTQAESSMGADTRFCVDWFQQYGFAEGDFGLADVLARAKGTSVEGVARAGVIQSKAGIVRLLRFNEYPGDWNPEEDKRTPIWEALHHIIRALQASEHSAGILLSKMPEKAEPIRQLAYRLYTLCERNNRADEARLYNGLISSWHSILEASQELAKTQTQSKQDDLDNF